MRSQRSLIACCDCLSGRYFLAELLLLLLFATAFR